MTDTAASPSLSRPSAADERRTILIVEDEFVNRELLRAALENAWDLRFAETGADALRVIRGDHGALSLVLLDLILPDIHGLDILRTLKEEPVLSRLPVIVMTSDRDSEVESLNLGAADFIPKPYPLPEVIRARVRRTVEFSENRDLIRFTERDHLTGLYNRDYFYRYAELHDGRHPDDAMDALVVDVSHFRVLNERWGRARADGVLQRIAAALCREAGPAGLVCRLEADKFQVYCPHRTDYAALAERVSAAAGDGTGGMVRVRLGACSNVDKNLPMDRRFDRAKMAADLIRDRYTESAAVYDDALHERELFEARLLDDFPGALATGQFLVWLQPKFDIRPDTPRLCGAEALVRWKHPVLGMVSPGIFIPLFESNGLIRDLDRFVWRETAARLKAWQDRGLPVVPVSVNVSRIDMLDPDLPEALLRLVREADLSPDALHLEITESAYTEDAGRIVRAVTQLRELGFFIEMDDFGAGYSSLNMLSTLPIDALKLDMQFIRNAFSENGNTRMLEIILDISEFLSVPMIAEGVETEPQYRALKEMGCGIVQGYYFARPMPAEDFESFLVPD